MMEKILCECGEAAMLYGRCIGCKRVRPSSKEVMKDLLKLQEDETRLLEQLEKAKKLEKEDALNEKATIEKARGE